jgi:hypothetical protein
MYVASKVISFNVISFCLFVFIRYHPVFNFALELSSAHIYCFNLDRLGVYVIRDES